MAYKTVSYSNLNAGDQFTFGTDQQYVKISPRRAAPKGAEYREQEIAIRKNALVMVFVPDPTPEEVLAQRTEAFRHLIERRIRDAQRELDKFAESFSKDAAYALEWADAAYREAARLKVAKAVKEVFECPEQLEDGTPVKPEHRGLDAALDVARRQALRGALWPTNSTSACTNLMSREVTSAWAEFVESDIYN
jgi:hypothetical protein